MTDSPLDREVCELCWALCEGELSPEGQGRLESLVLENASARRTYVQFMYLRGGLLWDKAAEGPAWPALDAAQAPALCPGVDASPARRWRPRAVAWLVLAASILLATAAWWMSPIDVVAPPPMEPANFLVAEYQARWESLGPAPRAGRRLADGRWTLAEGWAELQLGTNKRIVVEGPAQFTLEGAGRIVLYEGRLTAEISGDQKLRLETPHLTLVDLGTRFAVCVADATSEAHVDEGQVEVRVRHQGVEQAEGTILAAGEACIVAEGESAARAIPAAPQRFAWRIPSPQPLARELLAYEGFAYRGPTLGASAGGFGWSGPWAGFVDLSRESTALLADDASLASDASPFTSHGGHIAEDVNDWGFRQLAQPIDLDRDAVTYVSFLFRKLNPGAPGRGRWAGLSLFDGPSERLFVGTQEGGFRVAQLGQPVETGRMEPGETYFFVAKLETRAAGPEQAYLKVYASGQPADLVEPDHWTVVGTRDTPLQGRLDRVRIASETGYEIDEIRIGTTWESVAGGEQP